MDLFIPVLWFSFEMFWSRKPFTEKWSKMAGICNLSTQDTETGESIPLWGHSELQNKIQLKKTTSKQQTEVERKSPWLFFVSVYRYQDTVCLHLKPDIFSRLWPFVLFWFFDLFLKTGPYCAVLAGPDLMENLLSFASSAAVAKGRRHHSPPAYLYWE